MDGRARTARRRIGGGIAVVLAAAIVGGGGTIVASQAATPSAASSAAPRPALPPAPPPVGARFDYQLGGAYRPAAGAGVIDRDRADPPAAGRYSVCSVNAFQSQPQESRWWQRHHPRLLLRNAAARPVHDPDWPGEHVFDISTAQNRAALARIVGRWIDGCADKGHRAVEPDNLDTFTRWPERISEADALAYSRLLATRAHRRGLAIAQKNMPELGRRGRTLVGFDFAIAEECQRYRECGRYTSVYGRHVIEIEYTDTPRSAFTTACRLRGGRISVLLRDRDVLPIGRRGYRFDWCGPDP